MKLAKVTGLLIYIHWVFLFMCCLKRKTNLQKKEIEIQTYRTHSTHTVQQHFGLGNLDEHMQPYQVRLTSFFWQGIPGCYISSATCDMLTRRECRIRVAKGGKNVSHQVFFQNVQYIAVNDWRNPCAWTWPRENTTRMTNKTHRILDYKYSLFVFKRQISRRNTYTCEGKSSTDIQFKHLKPLPINMCRKMTSSLSNMSREYSAWEMSQQATNII